MSITADQFTTLVQRKFGNQRGYISAAAAKLNVHQGNLSSMLKGRIPVPQKHVDALAALQDFAPDTGVTQELQSLEGGGEQIVSKFTTRLTPQASDDLEFIARFHTKPSHDMPDLNADEDATARLFELVLRNYRESVKLLHYVDYKHVTKAIERDREDEKRQLNLDLQDRKHIVADELDCEDPVDPLS
jgi:hypothetical protein